MLLYQNESGGSFDGGASTRETGSFVTPGFLGVRCSTTSGFRYGWIEWPNDPSVPVALMLRGTNQFLPRPTGDLLVRPIRTGLGRPGQSIITGQQSVPDLWVERGSGGQTRLRWILESGQQIERWILGDPSGWQKYQTEGTGSALAEPSVPAALFRIRSSTN